eukprot:c22459_g2_i1 orf=43-2142(-)
MASSRRRWWLLSTWAALLLAGALQFLRARPPLLAARFFLEWQPSRASNESIAQHLYHLTRHPHVAGTPHNLHTTADYVLSAFRDCGLHAYHTDYQVLLSYPVSRALSLSFPNGTLLHTGLLLEEEQDKDVIPTFHAYSPSGDVLSEVVYVNYGRSEDYEVLRGLGVNLTGAIIIARYGKIYRGDIVALAAKAGAAAALIYTDPLDYAGSSKQGFYPQAPWLPPAGVQRGTVFQELGDPLTPGWPSTTSAERIQGSTLLPSIPSLPISALDALPILHSLEGPVAPQSWQGALDLPAYHIGRGPSLLHFSYLENQTIATIRNIFAVIRGSTEPDRYVLLGNHRDAWTYGAVDPNSGTAALLEVARRFGALQQKGWRPRRTIYLCNWDAEEYGLIGSTEWVEENEKLLSAKGVAYINVDMAVSGAGFIAAATPQLDDLLKRTARKIKDPDGLAATVYDSWVQPQNSSPAIKRLGGTGSDYAPFLQHAGVSAIDFTFGGSYPVYHSTYDNYDWMLKFGDPFFHRHVAIVQIWGLLALELADAGILPFDYEAYAAELQVYAEAIDAQLKTCNASQLVTVNPLFSAISDLRNAAHSILHEAKSLYGSTFFKRDVSAQERAINDRLLLAERAFLDAKGLARGDWYKHLVFGPTTNDDYASSSFPGVQDALSAAKDDSSTWALVQHEIWRAARSATCAALVLRGELT